MAYVTEAIAIGIGPQAGLGILNINAFVRDATNVIDALADANGATGILLREDSDLSMAFERAESDGGTLPGSLTRLSGTLSRSVPAVSFTIDIQGNHKTSNVAPVAGDFVVPEYLKQLYQGNRLNNPDSGVAGDEWKYVSDTADVFKTVKIWRGKNVAPVTNDEAWVLSDCTFNLTFNFTAGEVGTMTVDVFANAVIYQGPGAATQTTYPTAPDYGDQILAGPILQSAGANIGGTVRGFVTATLACTYPEVSVPDSNVVGGITNVIGSPRTVEFTASWYLEEGDADYLDLVNAPGDSVPVNFLLGAQQAGGAGGGEVNAFTYDITSLRVTNNTKEDSDANRVLRSIGGYATSPNPEQELYITAV
jgi:hypothetical protein